MLAHVQARIHMHARTHALMYACTHIFIVMYNHYTNTFLHNYFIGLYQHKVLFNSSTSIQELNDLAAQVRLTLSGPNGQIYIIIIYYACTFVRVLL